eukprot:scaffold90574_cov63-Phaeocystis_antarctica.AAC.1
MFFSPAAGQVRHSLHGVLMLFFETYGGWEPWVRLFRWMKGKGQKQLTKHQYEHEVSWSTSTGLALCAARHRAKG